LRPEHVGVKAHRFIEVFGPDADVVDVSTGHGLNIVAWRGRVRCGSRSSEVRSAA
jgi:hypothetical protein